MKVNGVATDPMQELVARRRPGYSLEQAFYVDPQVFEIDLDRIYRRHWLLAGPTCRLAKSGDFFRYDIANDSLVVLRDEAGEVRAFHNVCRHRGSRVCLEEQGHAKRLVCPYHQWSYQLDGALCSARHLPEGIDTRTLGLHPVQVRVVAGMIFVCLAEQPPDFTHTAADVAEILAPHELHRTRICRRTVEIIQANWKVVVENFWECYHCAPSHPEFCGVMSYAHAQNNERLAAERSQFEREWQATTRQRGFQTGRVERSDRGLHQGGRLPIRPGFVTQSQNGQPVAPLLGQYSEYDGGITSFTHLPLIWYVVSNDYALLTPVTPVTPVTPLQTELELTWLVHEEAIEGRDYDPDKVCWLWRITAEQDKTICENNQLGILSSRYEPGPYSTTESSVEDFIRWYLSQLTVNE